MKKSLPTFILLSILTAVLLNLNPTSKAEAKPNPSITSALQKCRQLLSLSSAQLTKVAAKNHVTVAFIKDGCYTLRHRDELSRDPEFALRGCYKYDRMSDRQLGVVARNGHTTIARIRHACYNLENPESSGGYTPNIPEDDSTPVPTPTPACQCGAFEVCVQPYGPSRCVDSRSNENQCNSSFDCKGNLSNCVSGKCT